MVYTFNSEELAEHSTAGVLVSAVTPGSRKEPH